MLLIYARFVLNCNKLLVNIANYSASELHTHIERKREREGLEAGRRTCLAAKQISIKRNSSGRQHFLCASCGAQLSLLLSLYDQYAKGQSNNNSNNNNNYNSNNSNNAAHKTIYNNKQNIYFVCGHKKVNSNSSPLSLSLSFSVAVSVSLLSPQAPLSR